MKLIQFLEEKQNYNPEALHEIVMGSWFLRINDSSCEEEDVRSRLKDRSFSHERKSVFVLSTAGIAEDGWAIYINGLVDSGLVVNLHEDGFLNVVPASGVSKTQRRGRMGRWSCFLAEST